MALFGHQEYILTIKVSQELILMNRMAIEVCVLDKISVNLFLYGFSQ